LEYVAQKNAAILISEDLMEKRHSQFKRNQAGFLFHRERCSSPLFLRQHPGELDGFQWYCERCGTLLYEEYFELTDIEKQFPPVFERFYANRERRTCSNCGSVMERAR